MSKRQLMRVHYLFGTASLGLSEQHEGIVQLNEAIEWAADLPDSGAYAELAYLAAEASSRMSSYSAAVDYAKIALGILRFLANGQASVDPQFEANVHTCLAMCEFMLARYLSAQDHLQQARCLAAMSPHNVEPLAAISQTEALLLRWRGQPQLALHHALASIDFYSQMPESHMSLFALIRSSSTVADIALELASSLPSGTRSSCGAAYAELARPYLKLAHQKAKQIKDCGGLHVVSLVKGHFDCVTGRNQNQFRSIEGVIRHAQRDNNQILHAQALSMLGQNYTTLGRHEAALHCFRSALDAIALTDAPAMGVFARRGLLLAQEMQV
jgi:tetratricopeptide (TPR) repeat protein